MKKILILGSDENGKFITHNYRSKKQTVKKDQQLSQTVVICSSFQGTLNKPHAKCSFCGREEWQHK